MLKEPQLDAIDNKIPNSELQFTTHNEERLTTMMYYHPYLRLDIIEPLVAKVVLATVIKKENEYSNDRYKIKADSIRLMQWETVPNMTVLLTFSPTKPNRRNYKNVVRVRKVVDTLVLELVNPFKSKKHEVLACHQCKTLHTLLKHEKLDQEMMQLIDA